MGRYFRRFSERYSQAIILMALCMAGLCCQQAAFGLTRAEMFQATVPMTDRSESAQSAAFQDAMKTVLIRVTGRRNAGDDPALNALVNNARRYVQQYRTTPDAQYWVAFDGPAIERWLTQNGQPLWGHERPTTLMLLAVQGGAQGGNVVTSDQNPDLKAAIDAAALVRGLPLTWPSNADLQKYHIDYGVVNGGSPSTFAEIARRMGCDGVLVGRATGTAATANVRWTHLFQDRSSEFSGTLEGVNRAADLYAGLFAASGSLVPVEIEVTGINDLRDYASVESFLESLTFISHVSVESLSGDAVRFRLATRGGAESLQRALSLNGRLQPVAGGVNGVQRFQLHR